MSVATPHIPLPDPLVDEVRQARARLDAKFPDDWKRYAEHVQQVAEELRRELLQKKNS